MTDYRPGGAVTTTTTSIPSVTINPSGGTYTWPSTSTSPIMVPTPTKTMAPELVDLPPRVTKKVLIAFLDENDEPVWAKKLAPLDMGMNFDEDGTARMHLELSLIKIYGD